MSKIMCIPCSVEFPSDAVYIKHKKSGHTQFLDQARPLEDVPTPTSPPGVLPEGVPDSAMPSKEFMETISRIESKKEETPAVESPKASQHPSELPASVPLTLEYIWKGEHEKCRRQPSTLKLEVGGKFFSVAYCESCKEQLESREVARL